MVVVTDAGMWRSMNIVITLGSVNGSAQLWREVEMEEGRRVGGEVCGLGVWKRQKRGVRRGWG